MYKFSDLSKRRMEGISGLLQSILYEALKSSPIDFGIAWRGGVRTPEQQKQLYLEGYSQKDGYNKKSKHQTGNAVDVLPYVKGQYTTQDRYYYILIGVIMVTAKRMEVDIRSGGDWDQDGEYTSDQTLKDLPHFELM